MKDETTTVNGVETAKKTGYRQTGYPTKKVYEDIEISNGNSTVLSIDKRLLFTALVVSLFVV